MKEPININSKCTAYTYKRKQQICSTQPVNTTVPYFATCANNTIYSTPKGFKGDLICPKLNARTDGEPTITQITFNGVGTMHLQRGCYVELEDSRTIQAQHNAYMTYELGMATMNEVFKFIPIPENYSFSQQLTNIFEQNEIPDLELRNLTYIQTPIEYLTTAVKAEEVVPHLIRMGIVIFVAGLIFAILYCSSPQFRAWIKACCFCNNPRKYWERRGYEIPSFRRIDPDAVCTEDMQDNRLLIVDEKGHHFDNDGGDSPILRQKTGLDNSIVIDRQLRDRPNNLRVRPLSGQLKHVDMKKNEASYLDLAVPQAMAPLKSKKSAMDTIMSHQMSKYKDRVKARRDKQMALQLDVLSKRAECLKNYDTPTGEIAKIERETGTIFSPENRYEVKRFMDQLEEEKARPPLVNIRTYNETRPTQPQPPPPLLSGLEYAQNIPLPPSPPRTAHNAMPNTSDGIRRMADILSSQINFRQNTPQ